MKKIFCLLLSFLSFIVISAQDKNILLAKDQLMFEHLGSSEGLMHNSITTVLQDSKGFIWFGTLNGLYKYDGYNFVFYSNSPDDDDSLLSNKIFT
ncbi:MAG: two-component regulator propeller domain-containing protein, partial [Flavicella sp.]